jgi:hypothetical protein
LTRTDLQIKTKSAYDNEYASRLLAATRKDTTGGDLLRTNEMRSGGSRDFFRGRFNARPVCIKMKQNLSLIVRCFVSAQRWAAKEITHENEKRLIKETILNAIRPA